MNSYIGLAVACPDYFTHKPPAAPVQKSTEEAAAKPAPAPVKS